MNKIIVSIIAGIAGSVCAEIAVPQGASVTKPVVVTVVSNVPVTKIEASRVVWDLPVSGTNSITAPRCILTKLYTDANGSQTTKTRIVKLEDVERYLAGQGTSLSNVVSVIANAVQMQTNEEFSK